MTRRAAAAIALALAVTAPALARPGDAPRYRFEVGQHLIYDGGEEAALPESRFGVERHTEIFVVSANGAARGLVVQQRHVRYTARDGGREDMPARVDLVVVDVQPDGRIEGPADAFGIVDRMLPRLPADAAAARDGWTYESLDVKFRCRGADGAGGWSFTSIPESDLWALQSFSATFEYEMDPQSGLLTAMRGRHRHEGRDTRTEREDLVLVGAIDGAELAALAADADRAATAEAEYRRAIALAMSADDATAGRAALAAARADVLAPARAAMRSDLFRAHLDGLLAGHDAALARSLALLAENAERIGRPAPDWALLDLDGAAQRLADLRGRVVVLDFWYRNCGWCIRATPQIEALAARFADRPVTVLGMNVDRDLADARDAAERVGMTYRSVRADRSLAAAYGVAAYPTFAVIDRRGLLRHVRSGYETALTGELGAIVEALLAEPD
jgi:thiol-disulfide isomerase/thioredoxin